MSRHRALVIELRDTRRAGAHARMCRDIMRMRAERAQELLMSVAPPTPTILAPRESRMRELIRYAATELRETNSELNLWTARAEIAEESLAYGAPENTSIADKRRRRPNTPKRPPPRKRHVRMATLGLGSGERKRPRIGTEYQAIIPSPTSHETNSCGHVLITTAEIQQSLGHMIEHARGREGVVPSMTSSRGREGVPSMTFD